MGRKVDSTRAMKPITREALRHFYLGHPMEPVPPETVELTAKLQQLAVDLQHGDTHMQQLAARAFFDTPTRIDDCCWRTRQLCEEAAHSLKAVATKSPDLQVYAGRGPSMRLHACAAAHMRCYSMQLPFKHSSPQSHLHNQIEVAPACTTML